MTNTPQQNPYGQTPEAGQSPYTQDPYAQQAGYGQGHADPYGQQSAYGTQPYGYNQMASAPMRPSMGLGQSVKAYFQNYARFNGRAGLGEFWWAQLGIFLISLVLSIVTSVSMPSDGHNSGLSVLLYIVTTLFGLATIIPSLALGARRLHDTNRSGWLQLLAIIPLIGWIVVIVLWCGGSKPEGARFDGDTQPKTGN